MRAKSLKNGLFVLLTTLAGVVTAVAQANSGVSQPIATIAAVSATDVAGGVQSVPLDTHAALPKFTTARELTTARAESRLVAQSPEASGDIRLASLSAAPVVRAAAPAEPNPQRSTKDMLLLTVIGTMLVAYQLLRKHRLLRQQPFSL